MNSQFIKRIIGNLTLTALALLTGFSNIDAQDHSLLYKIEGNGVKPSYIYGTIHILPQKDFNLKDKVINAFNDSELVVLELDMDDPGMQIEMMQNSMMTDGTTLDSLLDKQHYAKLDAALKEAVGIGAGMFNKMKPFVVSSMLLMKYVGEQPASFENTFVSMAKESEKEILGLETVTEQLGMFDKIPYQDQADDIAEMLDDPDSQKDMFADMVEVYKSEDITEMYDLMGAYFNDDENAENILLANRNNTWIPKIGAFAKEKSTFFGVGAGHLGGDQGVIALLKKAGYTVTPIMD